MHPVDSLESLFPLQSEQRIAFAVDSCYRYWWSNLLYINNFVPETDSVSPVCGQEPPAQNEGAGAVGSRSAGGLQI